MAKYRLPVEHFVDRYMTAHYYGRTREELAADISIKPASISNRAAQLRRQGIPLPFMPLNKKRTMIERAKEKFAQMEKQLAHSRAMAAERAKRPPIDPSKYSLDMGGNILIKEVRERNRANVMRKIAEEKAAKAERQKPNTPE
jgi:hypothetical protein